jgi:hypothetical protein
VSQPGLKTTWQVMANPPGLALRLGKASRRSKSVHSRQPRGLSPMHIHATTCQKAAAPAFLGIGVAAQTILSGQRDVKVARHSTASLRQRNTRRAPCSDRPHWVTAPASLNRIGKQTCAEGFPALTASESRFGMASTAPWSAGSHLPPPTDLRDPTRQSTLVRFSLSL